MIDRDEVSYTVALLQQWKRDTEDRATVEIRGRAGRPSNREHRVTFDEKLAAELTLDELRELEEISADLASCTDDALVETVRQKEARTGLQVVAEYLKRHGRVAHLEQLREGTRNCPRALSGLALPLLLLYVEHVVVVLDDALNGLFCYVLDSTELDREPLPAQEGWIRIADPKSASKMVVPLLKKRLRSSMVMVQ